ncbi:uncharacterized protein LOC124154068 [Ischnura elegans]|uniref:uncharacterized protein LOC124154068 n=1 Tax=Ischnura elegans TaxID=197161 RepID=UPI001ED888EE|nr:uncharacterized protein LOC124154068 [Ischnura elegans]
MVVNAKVFLLVGILVIGINFFPSDRGLTDAAPVKDPAITRAHHKAFDGMAEGIIEEARRGVYEDNEEVFNGRDTDDETNERAARDAGANNKKKRKGSGTQINVQN